MTGLRLALFDGREVALQTGRTAIGRGADNDLVLNLTLASRHHAEIWYDGRECRLVDLGSKNGTTLDGQPLRPRQPYMMYPGSVVSLGGQEAFRLEETVVAAAFPSGGEWEPPEPARPAISPWIWALVGLTAVLLLALAVLAGMALRMRSEEATATDTPAVVVPALPATAPPSDQLLPPTAMSLPTTALLETPVAQAPAVSVADPVAVGQPSGQIQVPNLLPTLQGLATSLAPLFPLGTPGALPGSERYPAPKLVSPGNGASFHGQGTAIQLTWEAVGDLKADEYYHVSVRYGQGGQARFAGDWVQSTEWRMPEWLLGQADQGRFEWDVTVRQATTIRQDGSKQGPALSAKSETRFFLWTDGGKKEADEEPEAPEEPTPGFPK